VRLQKYLIFFCLPVVFLSYPAQALRAVVWDPGHRQEGGQAEEQEGADSLRQKKEQM